MIDDLNLRDGIHVPSRTVRRFLWGGVESGTNWLEHLPSLVDAVCLRFEISQLRPSPQLSMNLVLFGHSAIHGPVVLKLAPPHWEMTNEIAAIRLFADTGHFGRLIESDAAAAWLLQECVFPGDMLQTFAQSGEISDAEATRITANLMRKSTIPITDVPPHTFPDLNRWLKALWDYARSGRKEIPADQLQLALRHGRELAQNPEDPMILHGDFHHGNILRSETGWIIIDPKGIAGDAAFEIGPFFYNPIGVDKRPDLVELFDARLDIFSEVLKINRKRLWRAALVACVLSDCWSLEGDPVEYTHFDTVTAALMQLPERYS